jgi:hypothetical protein
LGFPAHEVRHLSVFLRAQSTVEKRHQDLAIGESLHVLFLGVEQAGTEDEVEVRRNVQNLLVEVDQGDFATAARSSPIHAQLWFLTHAAPYPLMKVLHARSATRATRKSIRKRLASTVPAQT